MEQVSTFKHVNVLVDDLEAAVKFYRDDLGLEAEETPDFGMPVQFFTLAGGAQLHLNKLPDERPFRAHFALFVNNFSDVFRRMKKIGAIDVTPWGNVRQLPGGGMQMFVRDPSGNLVEIGSPAGVEIDTDVGQKGLDAFEVHSRRLVEVICQ